MRPIRIILTALLAAGGIAAADTGGKKGDAGVDREGPRKPRGEQRDRPGPGAGSGLRREFGERGGPGQRERGSHGRPHAERFLKGHDTDRDGAVSFAEFEAGEKAQKLPAEGLRRIFDRLDKNGDGKITRQELPKGPPPGGPGGGDKNGDGKISPEEFGDDPRLKDVPVERRQKLFEQMDHDGDGFLTRKDWRNRPDRRRRGRGPFLDRRMIEELDENGDNALSFEEWRKFSRLKQLDESELKERFNRLDRNRDGKLDAADRPSGPPRSGPRPGENRRGSDGPGPGPGPEGPPRRGPRPGA